MELSNLTNAFSQSSGDAKNPTPVTQMGQLWSIDADGNWGPAGETNRVDQNSELTSSDSFEQDSELSYDSQPAKQIFTNSGLTQEDILAVIQKDVDFSYDEKTNTFNIASGEIKPSTMDAIRAYFDMANGKYDEANIVVGESVTFETQITRSIGLDGSGRYTETVPSFDKIKCNSIDIQSQNIVNGDKMFAGAEANIIKIADQPNLESADNMFNGCTSSVVVIGKHPSIAQDDMFRGCEAVVLNPDLTDVIYDPAEHNAVQLLPETANPHVIPDFGQKIDTSAPEIDMDYVVKKIREQADRKHELSEEIAPILSKTQDKVKQAMDVLGLDDGSDLTSVEKSDAVDYFEK